MSKILRIILVVLIAVTYFVPNVGIAATTGSVQIISPTGGATYKIGDTVPLKWSNTYDSSWYLSVSIHKLNGPAWENGIDTSTYLEQNGYDYLTIPSGTSGSYDWTIPSTYKSGYYVWRVMVSSYSGTDAITKEDWSDSYFQISNSTVDTTKKSDIYLDGFGGFDSSELFFVGQVMLIYMTSNYVTPVSATVKSKSGNKTISPVWGDKTTTANGDWVGYLLPFTESQEGEWIVTVKTETQTLTKEFVVAEQLRNQEFDYSVSSQFAQVGGKTGRQLITNAESDKPVYFSFEFISNKTKKQESGGYYGDVGKTDSTGRWEFSDSGSNLVWTPKEAGIHILEVDIEGTFRQAVIEVSPNPSIVFHEPGTNIKGSDGTIYFINSQYYKVPYTSAGAFLSYKFNTWASVQTETEGDASLFNLRDAPSGDRFVAPREGSLINDNGTVYIITDQARAGFTSSKVFTDLGYSFKYVYPGDTSFMRTLSPIGSSEIAHPSGTVVNENGTLYLITNCYEGQCKKAPFPAMKVFESWGYWIEDVVPANSYDRALSVDRALESRTKERLSIGGAY